MSQDEFREVTDALSEASETAGTRHARDIAEPFAEGLPTLTHGDGPESASLRFARALRGSVESGKGALFATEFANVIRDMPQHEGMLEAVRAELGQGLKTVREDFEEKAREFDRLNQELGVRLREGTSTLSAAQLEKAATEFQDHPDYKKAVLELEAASFTLARTLPGAGRALELREKGLSSVAASANAIFQQLPWLGQLEAGQRAIADALEAQGGGDESLLTSMNRGRLDVDDPEKFKTGFLEALLRSAASRLAELARGKDVSRMQHLLEGLNANAESAGLKKDSFKDLTDAAKRYEDPKKFDPGRFAADLTGALKNVASRSLTMRLPEGVDPMQTPTGKRLAAFGFAVTGGALADQLTSSQLKDRLRGAALALGLARDIGKFLPENQLGSLFRGAEKLARPVAVIFDGIGIVQSLEKTDYRQAGFSAATLGANLIVATVGSPLAVGATAAVSDPEALLKRAR